MTAKLAVENSLDMLFIVTNGLNSGHNRVKSYLSELGFKNIPDAERFSHLVINIEHTKDSVEMRMSVLNDYGIEPPTCNTELPNAIPDLESIIKEEFAGMVRTTEDLTEARQFLEKLYGDYITECNKLTRLQKELKTIAHESGLIAIAVEESEFASSKMRKYKREADKYRERFFKAMERLEITFAVTNDMLNKTKFEVIQQSEAEKELLEVIKQGDKLNNFLKVGILSKARIAAINKVMSSLGTDISSQEFITTPDLYVAFVMVGTIATLEEQVKRFRKDGTGLTVATLLHEELHQSLLTKYVERLHHFAKQHVDILNRRSNAYMAESFELRRVNSQLCRLIAEQVKVKFKDVDCKNFKTERVTKNNVESITCQLGEEEIENCILGKPLREIPENQRTEAHIAIKLFSNAQGDRVKGRLEKYRALHVVDKYSMENLATFIRFWNKLIVAPLHQFLRETPGDLRLSDLVVKISSMGRKLSDFSRESRVVVERRLNTVEGSLDWLGSEESTLDTEIKVMEFSAVGRENLKLWGKLVQPITRKHKNIEHLADYETGIKELQSLAAELNHIASQLAVRLAKSPDSKYFTSLIQQLEKETQELSKSSKFLIN